MFATKCKKRAKEKANSSLINNKMWHFSKTHPLNADDNANTQEEKSVALSNEKFSRKLYHLLRIKNQNLVFSPFSISTVMAMLSTGARGKTLEEIKKGLFFPPSPTLQVGYKSIIPTLRSTDDFTIKTANKLFIKKDFSILRKFQQILSRSFQSSIQEIDFGDPKSAANEINNWVEDKTREKIRDLILPDMIDQNTRLVLINALYFKSNWAKKFDKAKPMKFHISPTSSIEVPMMKKSEDVFHAKLHTLSSTMVELPYKGGRVVMQILLPNTNFGLEDLEDKLKDVDIQKLFEKEHRKTTVSIGLPKFKQETTIQLNENLKKLGLKKMFSSMADLSGIDGGRTLYVSQVVQKALVEVDEEGTVAAAATAVQINTRSAWRSFEFMADHPFIFFLRDKHSGILLFQGRVINPLK